MVDNNGNSSHIPNTQAFDTEKEVNQQTGLEVDRTQDGLRTVSDTAGLETLPAEYSKGTIPQTNYDGPEKETWNLDDKEIILPDEPKELQRQSVFKRRRKLWALVAALLVVVVVVAVAVPLSVRHKSG